MSETKPFAIDLGTLKQRPKDGSPRTLEQADNAGEKHGFVRREPQERRGGRKPSPRTAQLHVWVLPEIAEAIKEAQNRTGKTQGALIEEAWAVYIGQGSPRL